MGHSTVKCPLSFRRCQMCVQSLNAWQNVFWKEITIQRRGDKRKVGIVVARKLSYRLAQMCKLSAKTQ